MTLRLNRDHFILRLSKIDRLPRTYGWNESQLPRLWSRMAVAAVWCMMGGELEGLVRPLRADMQCYGSKEFGEQ